jgi:chromosome partitioning protein
MLNKAKIIAIVNQKGGVGKTTSTINISSALAIQGKKTLLIDLDPQGNSSTGFGIRNRSKNIYNVLSGECHISEAILKTKIDNLEIISSNVDLSACEIELTNVENREYVLKNKLKDVIYEYEYILIDCPPSLGMLTINALAAIDDIIVPMQCEFFALEGLSHLLTTLELVKNSINQNLKINGIILTMYDKRNKLTQQVEKDVRNFLGNRVYKTIIPRNIKLSEAPSYGLPALIYDKNCPGSVAYKKLAAEIIETYSKRVLKS